MPPKLFYDLGPRGIVIHTKTRADSSVFSFALEQDWRQRQLVDPPAEVRQLAEDKRLPMALLSGDRVFVNLNALVRLDPGQSPAGTSTGTAGQANDQIILYEGTNFFSVVPQPDPIPDGFEQDAGVLVNRGAVIAAIPGGNIPIGTWCVLVNLAQLVR